MVCWQASQVLTLTSVGSIPAPEADWHQLTNVSGVVYSLSKRFAYFVKARTAPVRAVNDSARGCIRPLAVYST